MNKNTIRDHLAFIALAACVTLAVLAPFRTAIAETKGSSKRDIAVIDVLHPKEGNLLMLRGLVGRGTATFRVNSACSTMPVRFVAGDFSGQSVDVNRSGPIRIVITAPEVMRDLLAGRDLVSDMVRVTSDPLEGPTDLYLAHGLSADTGFVINPGRNLMADILGAGSTSMDCASLKVTLP